MKPVLTFTCNEPEGPIERTVYFLDLTYDNLVKFWERAKLHDTLFYDDIRGDFKKFCQVFLESKDEDNPLDVVPRGLLWVIDDFVGVYYMTEIRPARDAVVHYSFFDGRHRGRLDLTIMMLNHIFETYKFRRVSTEIASYAGKFVFPFVKNLGFKQEGKRRSSILYNGKWYDSFLFGLLWEELEWVLTSRQLVEVPQQV